MDAIEPESGLQVQKLSHPRLVMRGLRRVVDRFIHLEPDDEFFAVRLAIDYFAHESSAAPFDIDSGADWQVLAQDQAQAMRREVGQSCFE